jgi:hypothetical protein
MHRPSRDDGSMKCPPTEFSGEKKLTLDRSMLNDFNRTEYNWIDAQQDATPKDKELNTLKN